MPRGAVRYKVGDEVKVSNGLVGIVLSVGSGEKTGQRGRPKTVVSVQHGDEIGRYGVGDLKMVAGNANSQRSDQERDAEGADSF